MPLTKVLIRPRPFMYGDDVERPVNLPRKVLLHCLLDRDAPEVRRLIALSSRWGPGVNTERPEPEG